MPAVTVILLARLGQANSGEADSEGPPCQDLGGGVWVPTAQEAFDSFNKLQSRQMSWGGRGKALQAYRPRSERLLIRSFLSSFPVHPSLPSPVQRPVVQLGSTLPSLCENSPQNTFAHIGYLKCCARFYSSQGPRRSLANSWRRAANKNKIKMLPT